MNLLSRLILRRRICAELANDIQEHLEQKIEELMAAGMPREEAEHAARRQFGNVTLVEQDSRDVWRWTRFEDLLMDVRYGLRMLRKSPGFTSIAAITLALGIGANTAIFSVVNAILLKALPFHDSEQIVMLFTRDARNQRNFVSYPDFVDWRKQSGAFEEICAIVPQSVNLTKQGEPKRVIGTFVSANFFKMLGVEPRLGRDFRSGEDAAGADRVVVVSFGLWQSMFGGDPGLVGKNLVLNDAPYTVIGILPRDFHFPWGDAHVWLPYRNYPNFTEQRDRTAFGAIARMRAGVSLASAQSEMDTIAARLAQQYPDTNRNRGVLLTRFHDVVVEDIRPQLLLVWAMVVVVLLIACANVAGLMLARASRRAHEMNVRAAIGAGRERLVRQLLTESVLLWLIGSAVGTVFAYWGARSLATQIPSELAASASIDKTALAFSLTVAALSGLLFGLGPAIGLSRTDLAIRLKHWGRSYTGGGREWLRQGLVAAQIALALILLSGAGLLLRSLNRVLGVSLGFDERNVLTLEYRIPRSKYPKDFQQWAFHKAVVENVAKIPGVTSAAVLLALPFSGNGNVPPIALLDRPAPPQGQEPHALTQLASPEAFQTLGIPLVRGRVFTDEDSAGRPVVMLINRTMARRFWPDSDPLGRTVRLIQYDQTATIVGVVGDIKQFSLEDPEQLQIYLPYAQRPFIFATLVAKTESEPLALAKSVQQAVWSVDADQPVWKVRTMASLIDASLGPRRLVASLLGAFAALVLLLAALGIYGTLAFVVQQRTQEIGIRVALGGQRSDVLQLLAKQVAVLAFAGLAAGILFCLALGPLMRTLLFETSPRDPFIIAGANALLGAAAIAGYVLPALRALRVDPVVALRYE
jgi:predicted permease